MAPSAGTSQMVIEGSGRAAPSSGSSLALARPAKGRRGTQAGGRLQDRPSALAAVVCTSRVSLTWRGG